MLTADRVSAPIRRTLSSIDFGKSTITIALSGGGDSTALLCLLHDFLAERDETGRLHAVTVDHGLRLDSAAEAKRAGDFCTALGIPHEVRPWTGDKPSAGLQAAAREARYRLLAEAAEEAGSGIVLTGHTLDDQAETVAMRRARGSGRGLSGIAPATLYERKTWFLRPLLACSRAELRDYLRARGQEWIDDPSNLDPRFERVRLRGANKERPDNGAFHEVHELRCREAEAAADILADIDGWRFDRDERTAELAERAMGSRPGFPLALAAVMAWVGHGGHLPTGAVLEKAVAFCRSASRGQKITVAGCLMAETGDGVGIGREARNARSGGFGFDHLLPSPDFVLATALAERTGAAAYPRPPFSGYPV